MPKYGLYGGFEGDEAKLATVVALETALKGDVAPAVEDVVAVLQVIPHSGRLQFVAQTLCASKHHLELVRGLFQWCFEAEGATDTDDEFVLVGCETTTYLNSLRRYMMDCVMVAMPLCGSLCIELFKEYSRTSSQMYRMDLLYCAIKCTSFSDADLLAAYHASVELEKSDIVKACKGLTTRRSFIQLLITEGLVDVADAIYWAEPEFMRDALLAPNATEESRRVVRTRGYNNWKVHRDVYLARLRELLTEAGSDGLHKGEIYREFEANLPASAVSSEDILKLVDICQEFTPLCIDSACGDVKGNVTTYLKKLSREGQLTADCRAVLPVYPSQPLLLRISDRVAFLRSLLDQRDGGMGAKPGSEAVVSCILAAKMLRRHRASICTLFSDSFAAVPAKAFWLHLLRDHRNHPNVGEKNTLNAPMMRHIAAVINGVNAIHSTGENKLSLSLAVSWMALHHKNMPTLELVSEVAAMDEALKPIPSGVKGQHFLWKLWMKSVTENIEYVVRKAAEKGARIAEHAPLDAKRSGLTSYLGFAVVMMDVLEDALKPAHAFVAALPAGKDRDAVERDVLATTAMFAVAMLPTKSMEKLLWEERSCPAVEAYRTKLADMVVRHILANMETLMKKVFDVKQDGYLSTEPVELCKRFLDSVATGMLPVLMERCPDLLSAVLRFVCKYLDAVQLTQEHADLGFFQSTASEDDGKFGFRHFSLADHQRLSAKGQTALLAVLKLLKVKEQREKYAKDAAADAVAAEGWGVYRQSVYGHHVRDGVAQYQALQEAPKESGEWKTERLQFLSALAQQRRAVVCSEECAALAVAQQLHLQRENSLAFIGAMRTMRLIHKLYLEGDIGNKTACSQKWLEGSYAFGVEACGLRDELIKYTKGKDMHERISGHVRFLQSAVFCLEKDLLPGEEDITAFLSALEHVAKAIKNEAGLVRPRVYELLERNLSAIVCGTLSQKTEAAALKAATSVAQQLEQMLKDDVGKRDSVAKSHFERMAAGIIEEALYAPISPKDITKGLPTMQQRYTAVRKVWVECAIRLQFIVTRKNTGEQDWKYYVWPAQKKTLHPSWDMAQVDETRLLAVAEENFGEAGVFAVKMKYNTLRNSIPARASPLSILDCAAVLCETLEAVKQQMHKAEGSLQFLALPLGHLPPIDEKADDDEHDRTKRATQSAFDRMTYLVDLCGIRCLECADIWTFAQAAVAQISTNKAKGVRKAIRLEHLNHCVAFYTNLGKKVQGNPHHSPAPLETMCKALLVEAVDLSSRHAVSLAEIWLDLQKARVYTVADLHPMERQLLFHARTTEHKDRNSMDFKEAVMERRLCAMRELIFDVSKSAIHMYAVQSEIVKRRDDLLDQFIGARTGDFWGALRSNPPGEFEKADDIYKVPVSGSDLSKLNGECSKRYSELSLKMALRPGNSTNVRSDAVVQYVMSPSTGHTDIVQLLKTLMGDPENDALIEAVVLSVFKTDAAWHVLAHLMTPEALASSAQRTMATVLKNLCKWAPASSAVAVMKRLLGPERRFAVKALLHKNIIRELLASNAPEAQDVLLDEWNNRAKFDMHNDVQHELVRTALAQMHTAEDRSKASAAVWQILEEASDPAQCAIEEVHLLFLREEWHPKARSDFPDASNSFPGSSFIPFERAHPTGTATDIQREWDVLMQKRYQPAGNYCTYDQVQYKRHSLVEEDVQFKKENDALKRYTDLMARGVARIAEHGASRMIRLVARKQMFDFDWEAASGHVTNETLERIEKELLTGLPAEATELDTVPYMEGPHQRVVHHLAQRYVSNVMCALQLAEACPKTYTDFQRRQGFARSDVVAKHPAAQHHTALTRKVLTNLLDTPMRHALRRQHLSLVAAGLMMIKRRKAEWHGDLIQKPHAKLLGYFMQDRLSLGYGDVLGSA